jgi:hypothetical protein
LKDVEIPEVPWIEMFEHADVPEFVAYEILTMAKEKKATHVVKYRNQMLDSSRYGAVSFIIVGPEYTIKTPAEIMDVMPYIGVSPSGFKYPVCYSKVIYEEDDVNK